MKKKGKTIQGRKIAINKGTKESNTMIAQDQAQESIQYLLALIKSLVFSRTNLV